MADKLPTVSIKGADYVMVKDRILYFNQTYPNGCITTEVLSKFDAEMVIVKAKVIPDVANPVRRFVAYSQARWDEGFINKTSALENCETSAVGRALGFMGIGVIDSVASVDEITKAENQSKFKPRDYSNIPTRKDQPQAPPNELEAIGKLLESKGIEDKEDRMRIFKAITQGQGLNTADISNLKKEIKGMDELSLRNILKIAGETE